MTYVNRRVRFAPVAPVALLEDIMRHGPDAIGGYHLLLAHDVNANKDAFREWVTLMRAHLERHDICVIMDSSVIELGAPIPLDDILEASEVVRADVVVLPDVIGDHEATHDLVDAACSNPELAKYKTMFVPQGICWVEYIASLEAAQKYNWGTSIGLPRDAHKWLPSRRHLARASRMISPDKPIHMLGFSNFSITDDFFTCRSVEGIVGIDSAVPVRAGQASKPFTLSQTDYGERGDYWEHKHITQQALTNINYVRQLLSA